MPDNLTNTTGDVASTGGSRPSETGPGATGGSRPSETGPGATGGSPMGGGQAVPDAETLMGGDSALGDSGSLDDGPFNSGDSLKDEGKAVPTPKMSPNDAGHDTSGGDAPTGGLGGASSVGGD